MVTKIHPSLLSDDVPTEADLLAESEARETAIEAEAEARAAAVAQKLSGDVVQRARFATGAVITGTTVVQSVNPPAISEGTQVMALAFTPTNAANILKIRVVGHASHSVASPLGCMSLHAGGAALAVGVVAAGAAADLRPVVIDHEMVAGTTSEIPFTVRAGFTAAGTMTFNGTAATVRFGGVICSHITIEEIKA